MSTDEVKALRRRLSFLEEELEELSRLHEQALVHVEELQERAETRTEEMRRLEAANVRIAQLMEEVENREQEVREQASELAEAREELDTANRELSERFVVAQKARAHSEMELKRMGIEFAAARAVQQMLVPESLPANVPGIEIAMSYEPATETGGDWVAFAHEASARELTMVIGDVTGHGLGSALMAVGGFSATTTVAAMTDLFAVGEVLDSPGELVEIDSTRRALRTFAEPAQLLDLLDAVVRRMGNQLGMACFGAVYNYDSRELRFSNAGQCHPVLIGDSGPQTLFARGAQLGSKRPNGGARPQQSVTLSPGDLLLFYTDGVVEARSRENREVGVGRLVRWLRDLRGASAEEIKASLEERLAAFAGGAAQDDDMTFIVARISE